MLEITLDEQNSDRNFAMFHHLHSCEAVKFLFNLNNLPECINDSAIIANFNSHLHQTILNNATVIACNNKKNPY